MSLARKGMPVDLPEKDTLLISFMTPTTVSPTPLFLLNAAFGNDNRRGRDNDSRFRDEALLKEASTWEEPSWAA
jgi:hypothetical protein